MSLIQCPECGNQISSNAGHCVHCGYKFTVCPECDNVLSAGTKECPICGYRFSSMPEQPKSDEPPKNITSYDNFIDEWLNSSPIRKELFKRRAVRIFKTVWAISILICAGLLAYHLFSWIYENDAVQKLARARKTHSSITTLIGLLAFLYVLGETLPKILKVIKNFACLNWLGMKSFDPKERILAMAQKRGNVFDADELDSYADAKTVAYLKANPKQKALYFIESFLEIISEIITGIIVGVWANRQTDGMFGAYFTGTEYQITYGGLIVGVVLGLVVLTISVIFASVFDSKRDRWIGIENNEDAVIKE